MMLRCFLRWIIPAVLLPLGVTAAVASPHFLLPRTSDLLMFYVQPYGDRHLPDGLVIMDLKSWRYHQVTEIAEDAVWSPDGRRIAYTYNQLNDGVFDIFISDNSGQQPRNLSFHPAYERHPSFSPDGQQLMYVMEFSNPGDSVRRSAIHVVNLDGSGLHAITGDSLLYEDLAWSPDGRQVAFVMSVSQSRNPDLFVMNADGSNLRALTNTPEVAESEPAWSPDSQQLAYSAYENNQWHIVILDLNDGQQRQLTTSGLSFQPAWSPDGTRIAFSDARSVSYDIYVIRVDGSDERRITYASGAETQPVWAPAP